MTTNLIENVVDDTMSMASTTSSTSSGTSIQSFDPDRHTTPERTAATAPEAVSHRPSTEVRRQETSLSTDAVRSALPNRSNATLLDTPPSRRRFSFSDLCRKQALSTATLASAVDRIVTSPPAPSPPPIRSLPFDRLRVRLTIPGGWPQTKMSHPPPPPPPPPAVVTHPYRTLPSVFSSPASSMRSFPNEASPGMATAVFSGKSRSRWRRRWVPFVLALLLLLTTAALTTVTVLFVKNQEMAKRHAHLSDALVTPLPATPPSFVEGAPNEHAEQPALIVVPNTKKNDTIFRPPAKNEIGTAMPEEGRSDTTLFEKTLPRAAAGLGTFAAGYALSQLLTPRTHSQRKKRSSDEEARRSESEVEPASPPPHEEQDVTGHADATLQPSHHFDDTRIEETMPPFWDVEHPPHNIAAEEEEDGNENTHVEQEEAYLASLAQALQIAQEELAMAHDAAKIAEEAAGRKIAKLEVKMSRQTGHIKRLAAEAQEFKAINEALRADLQSSEKALKSKRESVARLQREKQAASEEAEQRAKDVETARSEEKRQTSRHQGTMQTQIRALEALLWSLPNVQISGDEHETSRLQAYDQAPPGTDPDYIPYWRQHLADVMTEEREANAETYRKQLREAETQIEELETEKEIQQNRYSALQRQLDASGSNSPGRSPPRFGDFSHTPQRPFAKPRRPGMNNRAVSAAVPTAPSIFSPPDSPDH